MRHEWGGNLLLSGNVFDPYKMPNVGGNYVCSVDSMHHLVQNDKSKYSKDSALTWQNQHNGQQEAVSHK